MKYYSTNSKNKLFSFEQAVMKGLADDGGLFMPEFIPKFPREFFESIENKSFVEIALEVSKYFIEDEIPQAKLEEIVTEAISFPAPIVEIDKNLFVLELFHGPTLAFKDFGARFMAKTMGYFAQKENSHLNILVATSGDTGSAVANGFYNTPGISVYILYPKGKVSKIQEQQLTTLDKNITALEIDGTFDDCQRLVKSAFVDSELTSKLNLSSANSINIARLLPQSFYYMEAYKQIPDKTHPVVFSVPSGNLGNITAGLLAKKMGLPIHKFIGATNKNDVFTEFIQSGNFNPRASVQTLSNAMDVGNPSNLARIVDLYSNSVSEIRNDIYSATFSDEQTREAIKDVFEKNNYVIDPHGAVGYSALEKFLKGNSTEKFTSIVLETAHPAKFKDVVEEELNINVEIPERLAACLTKEKRAVSLSSDYNSLKEYLFAL
ncbi:MAG: threonine synthase [Stygiobacter sp. RIFOXYC12_FULL_38_8]|nr:MAG: threonine synthase [Stygiobacter sp. GWC2_38_9]OGU85726.1 MAG: threonine synthase [Stygiobacter sp. RIFOXYA12_FULL_38_9]OGV07790.1 MAG: threonine synthase [Stygiobacter sp. RIFOXYB2_FULL_37_11]OGV11655.1 MAG: threonine synthase [Stygiobacter sp. RIFOXYA2_FULL_38_8]OGV12793.1 MAG: threonine synthase [Stygiobacter sp. RIFOXYC2_FULL_38_25]OGV27050.1 MAG: threonine synthase [Stygiobacter sp. RIFOXYC12_FULL_38_8]OGV81950.1 MAG: threonine synthase [Stygiobacter sp. GWF2_38_21]OGV92444.1 MA